LHQIPAGTVSSYLLYIITEENIVEVWRKGKLGSLERSLEGEMGKLKKEKQIRFEAWNSCRPIYVGLHEFNIISCLTILH
jgi:hypothetical protein